MKRTLALAALCLSLGTAALAPTVAPAPLTRPSML